MTKNKIEKIGFLNGPMRGALAPINIDDIEIHSITE